MAHPSERFVVLGLEAERQRKAQQREEDQEDEEVDRSMDTTNTHALQKVHIYYTWAAACVTD